MATPHFLAFQRSAQEIRPPPCGRPTWPPRYWLHWPVPVRAALAAAQAEDSGAVRIWIVTRGDREASWNEQLRAPIGDGFPNAHVSIRIDDHTASKGEVLTAHGTQSPDMVRGPTPTPTRSRRGPTSGSATASTAPPPRSLSARGFGNRPCASQHWRVRYRWWAALALLVPFALSAWLVVWGAWFALWGAANLALSVPTQSLTMLSRAVDGAARSAGVLSWATSGWGALAPALPVLEPVASAGASLRTASHVGLELAPILPAALGADGPKRYLISGLNDAETVRLGRCTAAGSPVRG